MILNLKVLIYTIINKNINQEKIYFEVLVNVKNSDDNYVMP